VSDFGLAHLQGISDLTLAGDMLGTLHYMSPEQAAGGRSLDPGTDIYSLGATLYELLTARPPFSATNRQELLRQIAFDQPPRLTRSNAETPRDLETIVQKAMAKEPAHRYASAGDFAEDLRRFLANQPILARRPGFTEKAARWAQRRHRSIAAGALLLVLIAVALLGGVMALWREQRRTKVALSTAQNARNREREALYFTFTASDQTASRVLDLMSASDPKLNDRDRQFCQGAMEYYQQMVDRYRADPEMCRITAAAYHRVGFIGMLLDKPDAEQAYHRSLALYESMLAGSPRDLELRNGLVYLLIDQSLLLQKARRLPEAVECLHRAVQLQQRLAQDFPEVTSLLSHLLFRQVELLKLLEDMGRVHEADEMRHQLGENYMAALRSEIGDLKTWNNLAWTLVCRPGTSLKDARLAVNLAGHAVNHALENGAYWNTLGVAQYRAGNFAGAAEALDRSIQLRSGGDPEDWLFLAMVRYSQGQPDTARRWFDRSRRWIEARPPASLPGELPGFQAEAARVLKLDRSPFK
jgi:tetratricopeptide (TPR) repeat protein